MKTSSLLKCLVQGILGFVYLNHILILKNTGAVNLTFSRSKYEEEIKLVRDKKILNSSTCFAVDFSKTLSSNLILGV